MRSPARPGHVRARAAARVSRRAAAVHPSALALAAVVAILGCSREPTGLRVVTTWSDLRVDQLEFTAYDHTGKLVIGPERRPAQAPARPLVSGVDVVIYFADALDGREVRCDVRAFAGGALVGATRVQQRLVGRTVVTARTKLEPGGDSPRPDGTPCTSNLECASRICADGFCCDGPCSGLCRACNVPGKQGTCTAVPEGIKHPACDDQGRESCGFDGTCDGRGACRKYPAGARCGAGACNGSSITAAGACDGAGQCLTGAVVTCAPFGCDPGNGSPRCHDRCTTAAECVPGRDCIAGSCGKKIDGATCAGDDECSSGFCTDGVCCEARCDGPCLSCAQTGTMGACRPVAAGVPDPRQVCRDGGKESCGQTGSCDGMGGCARYAAGTICRPAVCQAGSTTVQVTAGRCDGVGACQPSSTLACAPFACRNGACASSCQVNEDCAPGRVCDAAGSCGKKGLGQTCGAGSECASTFCVDGVCCNEACSGACRSCSLGRVPGMCAFTASGADDPRRICRDNGASSCRENGKCNGAGVCARYPAGTVCSPGTCNSSTNVRTLAGRCGTSSNCLPGATSSCAPYRCNGGSCFSACDGDSDCVSPNVCISGACGQLGAGARCTRNSECMAPNTCYAGICQRKPLGATCSGALANAECASGFCTEGVCCEAASCGRCRSCKITGSAGLCTATAEGTVDSRCPTEGPATCGTDGHCDGAGGCRNHPAGTVCVAASCMGRVRVSERRCDGNGMCQAGTTTDCDPFECNPATAQCFTTCLDDVQCCCNNRCRGDSCR